MDVIPAARRLIAGTAVALLSFATIAIEKYVTPDGKVIYSDTPVPGAQSVKKLESVPVEPNETEGRRGGPPAASSPGTQGGGPPVQRDTRLDAATQAVRDASDALEAAKIKRDTGREPRPNERQGTASGRSRLNDDYFERIKQLEKGVEDAQKRLDEAYRTRNNLR